MSHKNDNDIINSTHNTARFFVETRHVAWVLLIATCLWGVYGYLGMPQRKDPEVQVRIAVALVPWPGASAERVEQLARGKSKNTPQPTPMSQKLNRFQEPDCPLSISTLTKV